MRPVPTRRAIAVAALGLLPAVVAVLAPPVAWLALALDAALAVLVVVDFALAPGRDAVRVRRVVEPVLSSGLPNRVKLELEQAPGRKGVIKGEVRDVVAPGPVLEGHHQPLAFSGATSVVYKLTPLTRGDLPFGDVWLKLEGPLGLCCRQFSVPLQQRVRVFPDLTSLSRDALQLAKAASEQARRVQKVRAEGREFESLREYRPGDDRRSIDWKATARRAKTMVRNHQPERNQVVLLLLDCGRHMAGVVHGRRKLDHAVDAALRLARVSLDRGDQVGVMAFATEVRAWLPPRKGKEHLRAITQALYRVEATLEESDYGAALDLAFSRGVRRSLVVLLTDLLDAEASEALVKRARRLAPRHLPLVASLLDEDVHAAATAVPAEAGDAWRRVVASRLEEEARHTVATLRDGGAQVLRAPASAFGAATVNAYLDIKARGLL